MGYYSGYTSSNLPKYGKSKTYGSAKVFVPVTEPQIGFIKKLLNERIVSDLFKQSLLSKIEAGTLPKTGKGSASEAITELKACAFAPKDEGNALVAAASKAPKADPKPGFYIDPNTVTIYEVVETKQGGRFYAKVLKVTPGGKKGSWSYAPGAIKNVGTWDVFTLAQAEAFGIQYSFCAICGKTLTNPASIARGIGPICAGKF